MINDASNSTGVWQITNPEGIAGDYTVQQKIYNQLPLCPSCDADMIAAYFFNNFKTLDNPDELEYPVIYDINEYSGTLFFLNYRSSTDPQNNVFARGDIQEIIPLSIGGSNVAGATNALLKNGEITGAEKGGIQSRIASSKNKGKANGK